MKGKGLIRRILMRNLSAWHVTLYVLANVLGLAIVLSAMQFYLDCRPLLAPSEEDDALRAAGYMVLTKPVGVLGGGDTRFTAEEVADLRAQPWAEDAAGFTAAQFSVTGRVDAGAQGGLQTMMFLEAVPDQFLDVAPAGWDWTPESAYVPVVISADYLALYNFGFASSRGMRKLSPEMISQVPVTLTLSGRGGAEEMQARVVGFSERLNTIAVPQAFMDWANARFAPGTDASPSRLIVKPRNIADPAIADYIEARGYESSSPGAAASRLGQALRAVAGTVGAIGGVITLLSLLVLTLSIHLLLQKNRTAIADLLMLGYTPWQLTRCYAAMVGAVNALAGGAAIGVTAAASGAWRAALSPLGVEAAGMWASVAVGVGVVALLTGYNIAVLGRGVRGQG